MLPSMLYERLTGCLWCFMRNIKESYGPIGRDDGRFDIEFWQEQGDEAIFDAALDMIMDYLLVRHGHVDKPRLQRTVESFGRI